jgi:PhnB protein
VLPPERNQYPRNKKINLTPFTRIDPHELPRAGRDNPGKIAYTLHNTSEHGPDDSHTKWRNEAMAGNVNPIPEAYHAATPYLVCSDAAAAIEFYQRAFGAHEMFRMGAPGGKVGHAEIRIGEHAIVMLADECPEMDARSPKTLGGTAVSVYIYVKDVDALARQAEEAGARILRPVADQFYGDRSVHLEDPFGHRWGFATRVEELTPEEIDKRFAEMVNAKSCS